MHTMTTIGFTLKVSLTNTCSPSLVSLGGQRRERAAVIHKDVQRTRQRDFHFTREGRRKVEKGEGKEEQ